MQGSGGAAQGAMQTSLQNQGQAAQGIQAGVSSLNSQAGMLNAPLPATMQGISGAIASGGNLSGQTGVNQNQVGKSLVDYASNPTNTQLAGANSGLQGFYKNEMSQGLNQQTQNNAQSQLSQQLGLQEAQLNNSATPGRNLNNQKQQMQNAELGQSANLAGNMAGQSQQIMQQGASGIASTAGNMDTQAMNMLQTALSSAQGLNSSQLQNLISVLGLGTSAAQSGASDINAANTAQSGLFSGYSTDAQNFGAQAQQNRQSGGLGGLLGSAAGLFSPIKIGGGK